MELRGAEMSGFNFTKPFGADPEETYELFLHNFDDLITELDLFIDKAKKNIEIRDSEVLTNTLVKIEGLKSFLLEKCSVFFQENKNLLIYPILGKTFFSYIIELKTKIPSADVRVIVKDLTTVLFPLQDLVEAFNTIQNIAIKEQQANELIDELKKQVQKATQSAKNVESAKLAIEANETDKIYLGLSDKYEEEYEVNNEYFRNSLIITVSCTILSIAYTFNTPIGQINWPVFISVKLLIIAVGVMLCTLFLRRSAHAKKLHEKAYQTHVEINAYPIFIKSLKDEDQQEITKELALRYFGKDIDQTQNDKIGDLVQDQLSAGTELIRASAEMVKVKQGESKSKEE